MKSNEFRQPERLRTEFTREGGYYVLVVGFVLTGAITVETIFSIPGLGLLATEALTIPDYWVLQGTFLVASAAVIAANLLANLVYGLLDPRVRT